VGGGTTNTRSECDNHRCARLAFLQLGELTKARACSSIPQAGQSQTWCTLLYSLSPVYRICGMAVWTTDALLLEATAMSRPPLILRCTGCEPWTGSSPVRSRNAITTEPRNAQGPSRSIPEIRSVRQSHHFVAYLELSGYEVAAMGTSCRHRQRCGPHQAAFRRVSARFSRTSSRPIVAYRLAQSRRTFFAEVGAGGPLLATLLADQPCGPASRPSTRPPPSQIASWSSCGHSVALTLREIARNSTFRHTPIKTQVSSLFRKLDAHDRPLPFTPARERWRHSPCLIECSAS